jgi:hypothetical protein
MRRRRNLLVEESVPSYIEKTISHVGCYTDDLFVNDILRTLKFPICTEQLFTLNQTFVSGGIKE